MKTLFLDVDGVLNAAKLLPVVWQIGSDREVMEGLFGTHPEPIGHLNRIIEVTDARIVLSSAWRNYQGISGTLRNMAASGFKYPRRMISQTPHFPYKARFEEIANWIDERRQHIESFVILDDMSSMGPLQNRLVQTDEYGFGLTSELADRAIAMLAEAA